MDLIFLLCFAYACYRAGLDAAVKGYALSRGRDVYIGEGANRRQYTGFAVGTVLGVFFRSLVEGLRVGWPWARDTATRWHEGRRRGEDWTAPWNDMRPPRKPRQRRRSTTAAPADEDHVDDAAPDDLGDADDPGDRCVHCGADLTDPDRVPYRRMPQGRVCWSHFDDHCAACGTPAGASDPLVLIDGYWLHTSHQRQKGTATPPDDPDGPGPTAPLAADVIDEAGQAVDAVWEPATAAWASLHPNRTP